ncbi:nucleotide-diphospho-sugar transferase [Auricularia subglabra TFB-10046 SS5]|nr:nucleotide-diphospho-sugar transferase [Auricularia subglabra TFB-10046 SS5]
MLKDALDHLENAPQWQGRSFELVIVDDGSRDNTHAIAIQFAQEHKDRAEIRVVRLLKNRGKGGAVTHGMLHARGERLLMVDADGASRFSDIDTLWDELDGIVADDKDGRAVAVGSRAHLVGTQAVVKRSAIRNMLMYSFHFILKTLGVGHIHDTQCGFKLFTRPAALQLFGSLHLTTWIFDVELLILALILDIPVVEVPVHWHEVAGSKLNLMSDSIGMLKDLLVLRANYALGRWTARR